MKPPPSRSPGLSDLSRRQWLAALLSAAACYQAARLWLLPAWAQRLAEGRADATHALRSLTAETAGMALFGFGATGIACTVYNRTMPARMHRAAAPARELAFLASLGRSRHSPFHNDPIDPR